MNRKLLICFFYNWLLIALTASAQIIPKKLLIYYGYPSGFNYPTNGYVLANVANDMAQYDRIVLGAGLEKVDHPNHIFTQDLINHSATSGVRFFGYIDLGISNSKGEPLSNFTQAEIETRIREWKAMGIDGIFFDDVEYGFKVSRSRMNAAVQHAHMQSLPAVVNGNRPDDIFGQQIEPTYNPTGLGTPVDNRDIYLSESFLISESTYVDLSGWQAKATLVENYRQQIGFRIWSVTTTSLAQANTPDSQIQPLFNYAWYGAWLYGYDATGWGEYGFSARDPNNGISPFRVRPSPTNPGTAFLVSLRQSGTLLTRYTNTGQIQLDSQSRVGSFVSCGSCQSKGSGSWQAASLWTCGRIPLACDIVEILSGHTISMGANADAGQLILKGKLLPSTYRLRVRIY